VTFPKRLDPLISIFVATWALLSDVLCVEESKNLCTCYLTMMKSSELAVSKDGKSTVINIGICLNINIWDTACG